MNGLFSTSSLASLDTPTSSSSLATDSSLEEAAGAGPPLCQASTAAGSLMGLLRESLKCKICYELFDADRHRPVVLNSCGHTFCHACMAKVYQTAPVPKTDPSAASAAAAEKKKKKPMPSCPCCGKKLDRKMKDLTLNWSVLAIVDDTRSLGFRETCDQFRSRYEELQRARRDQAAGRCVPASLEQARGEIAQAAAEAVRQIEAQKQELLRQVEALEDELSRSKASRRLDKLNRKLDEDAAIVARKLAPTATAAATSAAGIGQMNEREMKKLGERIDVHMDYMARQTRLLASMRSVKMVEFKENAARRELLAGKGLLGELTVLAAPSQVAALLEQSLPQSSAAHSALVHSATCSKLDAAELSAGGKQRLQRSSLTELDHLPVVTASSLIPLDPASLDLFATISNGF